MNKRKYIIGVICMMVTNLSYGFMPAISQKAFAAGLLPQTLLLDRFIVALILIWGFIFITKQKFQVTLASMRWQIGLLGLLNFGVTVFLTESYKWLPGSVASLLVFSYVSIVIILEILFRRTPVERKKVICVCMSSLGLVLVIYMPGGDIRWQGIVFAMLTATCYALYSIGLGSRKVAEINSISLAGWIILIMVSLNLLRAIISGAPLYPSSIEQSYYILTLGFFCSFLGPLCIIAAIKLIGASNAAINNTLEPVIAYLVGVIWVGELVENKAIVGAILILLSVIVLNLNTNIAKSNKWLLNRKKYSSNT